MKVLGIEYDNITVQEALERIGALLKSGRKSNVFFLNADCLYKAQKDAEYRDVLEQADLLLSDGVGLKLATKIFGGEMKANCNGTDLSPLILKKAAQHHWGVFLIGGKEGIANKAAANAMFNNPGLNLVGSASGYFSSDTEVIEKINNADADIVFVAMGAPLQEKWIIRNRSRINARLCLGVGAFLDYLSGSIPRAPLWMRKAHLEWFWRIFVDPKRMVKRYLIDGVCFVGYAIYMRLKGKA